jgi:hypothetical protein
MGAAFILAQFIGGLVGAGLVYGLYFRAIDMFEGTDVRTNATAGIFVTFPVRLSLATSSPLALPLASQIAFPSDPNVFTSLTAPTNVLRLRLLHGVPRHDHPLLRRHDPHR